MPAATCRRTRSRASCSATLRARPSMTVSEGRPVSMRVVRLRAPGGPEQLAVEEARRPRPGPGEVLVRVQAAAITRDELQWPVDRLPAIPSYELAGVVEEGGPGAAGVAPGDEVFALPPFDRDGVAADYTAVPAELLAAKPRSFSRAESAAIPLPALTAWQGLFDHGRLASGRARADPRCRGRGGARRPRVRHRWRRAARPSVEIF